MSKITIKGKEYRLSAPPIRGAAFEKLYPNTVYQTPCRGEMYLYGPRNAIFVLLEYEGGGWRLYNFSTSRDVATGTKEEANPMDEAEAILERQSREENILQSQ